MIEATTKHEVAVSIKALAHAIEATVEPDRIQQHLKELQSLAKRVRQKNLAFNSYWVNN